MDIKIPLTKGGVAIINVRDSRLLTKKWFLHSAGYAVRNTTKSERRAGAPKLSYMHKEILPGCVEVDHRDQNKLNNRRHNLRPATKTTNQQNRRPRRNRLTKFKGIRYDDDHGRVKKWRARITVNGSEIHLGRFEREEEAARAYDRAARKYFGEFALLNFPDQTHKPRRAS